MPKGVMRGMKGAIGAEVETVLPSGAPSWRRFYRLSNQLSRYILRAASPSLHPPWHPIPDPRVAAAASRPVLRTMS